MKVGLLDIDGKIPNFALMKISSYHKSKGDEVELCGPLFADGYDKIYASKIFTFSELPTLPDGTTIGGSGHNLLSRLPGEIENEFPDYSLYNCDYAIGFTSRGCNRRCPFCIVPEKEGRFNVVGDIYNFWEGQDKLMLLDNSLNTDEDHFSKIIKQLVDNGIHVDFNQGLDIRHLTERQAHLLSFVKLWKQIHFAWDFIKTESSVIDGIKLLGKYNLKNRVMFYVLIGFNSTREEDYYRITKLREWGVDSFVMPYDKNNTYQKRFARWVNHKAIFKTVDWKDYK